MLAIPEAVTSASAGGAATSTGAGISFAALLMKRRPRAAEVARGVAVCGAHTHEATEGVVPRLSKGPAKAVSGGLTSCAAQERKATTSRVRSWELISMCT